MRPGGAWLVAATAGLVGFVGLAVSVTRSTALAAMDSSVQRALIAHRSATLTIALVKVGVGRGPEDRIGPAALDFAFSSGHTGNGAGALCLVTALVWLTLPRSVPRTLALAGAVVLSAGIGLTRVYLGYHWPSDVVGGWLLATSFTCAAVYVVRALRTGLPEHIAVGAATVSSVEHGR